MKEEKFKIGSKLKAARSGQGISFEKASRDTRIAQRYLKSIEEEKFSDIPGRVVLKGFIKIYADYLKVDVKPLIDELSRKIEKEEAAVVREEEPAVKMDLKPLLIGLASAAAAAVVLFTVIAVFNNIAGCMSAPKPHNPAIETAPVASPERLHISVSVLENTWVLVQADDRAVFSGILAKGVERSWDADEKIFLRIGNAAGVRVMSGGKVLLEPGLPGQVISKTFTR